MLHWSGRGPMLCYNCWGGGGRGRHGLCPGLHITDMAARPPCRCDIAGVPCTLAPDCLLTALGCTQRMHLGHLHLAWEHRGCPCSLHAMCARPCQDSSACAASASLCQLAVTSPGWQRLHMRRCPSKGRSEQGPGCMDRPCAPMPCAHALGARAECRWVQRAGGQALGVAVGVQPGHQALICSL